MSLFKIEFLIEIGEGRIKIGHIENKSKDGTTIRIPFAEAVKELLSDNRFVLCGASMVVNLQHIIMIENDSVLFYDNSRIYISKRSYKELRQLWQNYCSGQ